MLPDAARMQHVSVSRAICGVARLLALRPTLAQTSVHQPGRIDAVMHCSHCRTGNLGLLQSEVFAEEMAE